MMRNRATSPVPDDGCYLDDDYEPVRCDSCNALIRNYVFEFGITETVTCRFCRGYHASMMGVGAYDGPSDRSNWEEDD